MLTNSLAAVTPPSDQCLVSSVCVPGCVQLLGVIISPCSDAAQQQQQQQQRGLDSSSNYNGPIPWQSAVIDVNDLKARVAEGIAAWAASEDQPMPAVEYTVGPSFTVAADTAAVKGLQSSVTAATTAEAHTAAAAETAVGTRAAEAAARGSGRQGDGNLQLVGCFPCCLAATDGSGPDKQEQVPEQEQQGQQLQLLLAPRIHPADQLGASPITIDGPAVTSAGTAAGTAAAASVSDGTSGGRKGHLVLFTAGGEVLLDEEVELLEGPQAMRCGAPPMRPD